MRKDRVSDEIVSLNMYLEDDDSGYLTSMLYYDSNHNLHAVYEKDRPCYFTKCSYIHHWHRQFLIKNKWTLSEMYNRCTENRPVYNKKCIL